MTIEDILGEFYTASQRFWFVREAQLIDQTEVTVTLHFRITPQLFVQVFLNEKSRRFSLALIGPPGRLYGRDLEYGRWHRHPFDSPQSHEATPEGMSSQPLIQFLAEVEEILLANDLL